MSEGVGFWIGLEIDIAHVTVVIRHGCKPVEVELFKEVLSVQIAPLLPIAIMIDSKVVMRGYKGDVPTLTVHAKDPYVEERLKEIYRQHYQQIPEHTAYPELEMHMTIDKPELKDLAAILLDSFEGRFIVTRATLKKVGDKTLIDSVKSK